MGERYYLTGVQLGMLLEYLKLKKYDEVSNLLLDIERNQFIGNLVEGEEVIIVRQTGARGI